MKAISIGFSTEDDALFLDQIPDLAKYEHLGAMYYEGIEGNDKMWTTKEDLINVGLEQLKASFEQQANLYDIAPAQPDLKLEYQKAFAQKVEEFLKLVEAIDGPFVAYLWCVEYDDNLCVALDCTVADVQALKQAADNQAMDDE